MSKITLVLIVDAHKEIEELNKRFEFSKYVNNKDAPECLFLPMDEFLEGYSNLYNYDKDGKIEMHEPEPDSSLFSLNDLSDYRIKNAKSRLDASKMLLEEGFYKDSINRSYYAIFDSMRTVLAEEGVDYKKHTESISN